MNHQHDYLTTHTHVRCHTISVIPKALNNAKTWIAKVGHENVSQVYIEDKCHCIKFTVRLSVEEQEA